MNRRSFFGLVAAGLVGSVLPASVAPRDITKATYGPWQQRVLYGRITITAEMIAAQRWKNAIESEMQAVITDMARPPSPLWFAV